MSSRPVAQSTDALCGASKPPTHVQGASAVACACDFSHAHVAKAPYLGRDAACPAWERPSFFSFRCAAFRGSRPLDTLHICPRPRRPHLPTELSPSPTHNMSSVEASFSSSMSHVPRGGSPTLEHGWRWGSATQLRNNHGPVGASLPVVRARSTHFSHALPDFAPTVKPSNDAPAVWN